MEYIGNKLRRYTTFSKRKTGIMKKAYELSTLTGTQVMLLVASETGHVYTYATKKLQPMISSETGKALIQTCLNAPGEGTDLQPSRCEFTFDASASNGGAHSRKRKMTDQSESHAAALQQILPTMVPSSLFSSFCEEDYANDENSDDSDSEEASDTKEEEKDVVKDDDVTKDMAATLQQTLKDALKAAANNRQQQQQQKRARQAQQTSVHQVAANHFLAPFLLQGLSQASSSSASSSPTSNLQSLFSQLTQANEGGAHANALFNGSSMAEEASGPTSTANIFSLPIPLNLQQFMESAALGAQITNAE